MKAGMKILLGSGSPRRKQLLHDLGFSFRVVQREVDETPPPGMGCSDVAVYLAEKKAAALTDELHEDEILLTADTDVCLNGTILGKPSDRDEAVRMLGMLSGRAHYVYTGVCIVLGTIKKSFFATSKVTFKEVTKTEIERYIDLYLPYDKAGSYGAQESLPPGYMPCSKDELAFLDRLGKPELYRRTLAIAGSSHVPLIESIEGGYFNVMGLPVVEVYKAIAGLQS